MRSFHLVFFDTDWSSVTLLFQDDCGGLEVEDVSQPGTFIPAAPIKNALVVNAGDVLQMWSNGTYSYGKISFGQG